MTALCPQCGFDLRHDEPIASGGLTLDLRGAVTWQGRDVHLRPAEKIIVASIVKAAGRTLPAQAIAERFGYEGYTPGNVVGSHVSYIRTKMPGIPIETVWGLGYRWTA